MVDQHFIERLARELVFRIGPQIHNGNGGQQLPRLLNAEQAARYLGRPSARSIYHLVERREIPYLKHGRSLRFDRLELDKWIESDKARAMKRVVNFKRKRGSKSMSGKNDELKSRDWSTDRATKVENGAIGGGTTKETHVRNDGRYIVEKNKLGDVLSIKKIA